MGDYRASIDTKASVEASYKAIAEEMSVWWTTMSGQFLKVGDEAQTDFGGASYWRFKAQTLDKPNRIELRCCEARHIHDGLPETIREEWLNTVLQFDILKTETGSNITLTHQGLKPELQCFGVCKAGWDHYFKGSLLKYLNDSK